MRRQNLEQRAVVEVLRTHNRLHDQLAHLLKEHGLSEPQFNVLRILRGAGREGLSCQAVAERMITRQPDITRLLDRLESLSLIARDRSREDRRVVVVSPTKKGLEILAKLDGPVATLHRRQLGHMTRSELMTLIRLLEKARQHEKEGSR